MPLIYFSKIGYFIVASLSLFALISAIVPQKSSFFLRERMLAITLERSASFLYPIL